MFMDKLKEEFSQSYAHRVFRFLFSDDYSMALSETIVGKILKKLYLPYAAELCLCAAIFLFWYEGLIARYVPFLGQDFLAPTLILVALIFANKEKIIIRKFHLWYLFFLLAAAFSALLAVFSGLSAMMLFFGWAVFALFFVALVASQSIKDKMQMLKGLVWASIPISLVGIYQFFSESPKKEWFSTFEQASGRAYGFFGSPNVLGILMCLVVFLSLGIYLREKKNSYLLVTALSALAIGLSLSRTAWLALFMSIAVAMLVYRPKWALYSPLALILLIIPKIRDRILILFSPNYWLDSSLDGRFWSYINSVYLFKKYPILGTGPGSYGGKLAQNYASPVYLWGIQNGYTALYYTDNQYLEILVQTGILGIAAFLGFAISVFAALLRVFKEKRDFLALAGIASFSAFFTSAFTANVLEFSAISITLAVILGCVLAGNEDYMDITELKAEQSDPEFAKALEKSKKQFELGRVGNERDIFATLREQK